MNTTFDLIEAIHENAGRFREETGFVPHAIEISPTSYRRLLELRSQDESFGNLLIGCTPLSSFETAAGTLSVLIDELLSDTEIVVS